MFYLNTILLSLFSIFYWSNQQKEKQRFVDFLQRFIYEVIVEKITFEIVKTCFVFLQNIQKQRSHGIIRTLG